MWKPPSLKESSPQKKMFLLSPWKKHFSQIMVMILQSHGPTLIMWHVIHIKIFPYAIWTLKNTSSVEQNHCPMWPSKKKWPHTHTHTHTALHMLKTEPNTHAHPLTLTHRGVLSPWEAAGGRDAGGQRGGIDISAVFGVLQLIGSDFSETGAHPRPNPIPPPPPASNCLCLFINSITLSSEIQMQGCQVFAARQRWWRWRWPESLQSGIQLDRNIEGEPAPHPAPSLSAPLFSLCLCAPRLLGSRILIRFRLWTAGRQRSPQPLLPHTHTDRHRSPAETFELRPERD